MTTPAGKNDRKHPLRKVFAVLGTLMIAAGILLALPALAVQPTRNPARLLHYFERYSDGELLRDEGFPLPEIAEALSLYLGEQRDTPQVTLNLDGETQPAFSDRELLHLYDVRSLFGLARDVFLAGLGFVLAAAILSLIASEGKPLAAALRFLGWLPRGAAISLAAILLLAAYVIFDFTSAFTLLHLSLFSNDLWLLDPANDLLLRLMPEGFFIALARDALLKSAALLLALIILPPLAAKAIRGRKRGRQA